MAGEIGRKTDHWGSRFGFIMAAVGSSVGLGNFWRFPFTAGENGGGAFIIIYLFCVLFLGLTVLMAEYAVGRKSGMSAIEGIHSLARAESKSENWQVVGWIGSLGAFFILTFYIVISAWVLAFIPQAFGGNFGETISNKYMIGGLLVAFLLANVIVVARGVKGGIEKAATVLMPAFFILLIGIVGFALIEGDAGAAADFLLTPDFSEVTMGTFLEAVGQAFFSLSVGSCLMVTYGAYLSRDTNIPRASAIVASADTMVALIAGFAIFPIVFAFGADPAGGPGLFFVSMPIAFSQMGALGVWVGGAFFLLALFAAFTSSISLMEVGVAWLEEREGVTRPGAAMGIGFVLFMIGMGYVYSTDFIDFADIITGNIMLPLCALLLAVFAGWILSREMLTTELGEGTIMNLWRFMCRWVVPPALAFILVLGTLTKLGVI